MSKIVNIDFRAKELDALTDRIFSAVEEEHANLYPVEIAGIFLGAVPPRDGVILKAKLDKAREGSNLSEAAIAGEYFRWAVAMVEESEYEEEL